MKNSIFIVMSDESLLEYDIRIIKEILITKIIYKGIGTKHKIIHRINIDKLINAKRKTK